MNSLCELVKSAKAARMATNANLSKLEEEEKAIAKVQLVEISNWIAKASHAGKGFIEVHSFRNSKVKDTLLELGYKIYRPHPDCYYKISW